MQFMQFLSGSLPQVGDQQDSPPAFLRQLHQFFQILSPRVV